MATVSRRKELDHPDTVITALGSLSERVLFRTREPEPLSLVDFICRYPSLVTDFHAIFEKEIFGENHINIMEGKVVRFVIYLNHIGKVEKLTVYDSNLFERVHLMKMRYVP